MAEGVNDGGPVVALVGCGRWGVNILRDLRALGCPVPVVARSPESQARARDGGAARIVPSIAALGPVDGVVVATPTATHADVLDEVLAAHPGPVYVEKPMTDDPVRARQLADAHPDRLFVMDKWRYHPGVRELSRIVADGELGPVGALVSRRVTDTHRYADTDTVWIHMPHDLAIARHVLGELPPARHAVDERVRGERVGMTAVLGGPPWVTIEVSCVAPGHRRELRLVCDDGAAHVDGGWSDVVTITRGRGIEERRPVGGELPLLAELRAFTEHVAGGPPPHSSAAEGAESVERIAELGALAAPAAGALSA